MGIRESICWTEGAVAERDSSDRGDLFLLGAGDEREADPMKGMASPAFEREIAREGILIFFVECP